MRISDVHIFRVKHCTVECMHTSDLFGNYWTFLISMGLAIIHWQKLIQYVHQDQVTRYLTAQNEATWRTECTILCVYTYACKFCDLPSYICFSCQYWLTNVSVSKFHAIYSSLYVAYCWLYMHVWCLCLYDALKPWSKHLM